MREARQLEQSHNPNYLKSSAAPLMASSRNSVTDGCEDIPIAELALDIPLQITCKFLQFFDESKYKLNFSF